MGFFEIFTDKFAHQRAAVRDRCESTIFRKNERERGEV